MPFNQLVKVYKKKAGKEQEKPIEINSFLATITVADSLEEIVLEDPRKTVYIYSDKTEELAELERLAKIYDNVVVCSDLLKKMLGGGGDDKERDKKRKTKETRA